MTPTIHNRKFNDVIIVKAFDYARTIHKSKSNLRSKTPQPRAEEGKLTIIFINFCLLPSLMSNSSPEAMRSPVNQVFQFKVELTETGWKEGKDTNTVSYLWIPETSKRVNGVLVLCSNSPEHTLVGHDKVRKICRKNNLAIFWGVRSFYNFASKEPAKVTALLEKILTQFAEISGYDEISTAPWIPLGESGHLLMVEALLNNRPQRSIAGVALKDPVMANRAWEVPLLSTHGSSHEWNQTEKDYPNIWNGKDTKGGLRSYSNYLKTAKARPTWPASLVLDPESGHFEISERLVEYVCEFIDAIVPMRLNVGGKLKPIDFSTTYRADLPYPNRNVPGPVSADKSVPGFWFPTRSLAKKAQDLANYNWDSQSQLVGAANADGDVFKFSFGGISYIDVNYPPKDKPDTPVVKLLDDGITFELQPVVFDKLPSEFKQAGFPLAKAPGIPTIEWVCGAFKPLGNNRFHMALDRTWPSPLYLAVRHPGTDKIRGVCQPIQMSRWGEPQTQVGQTISFERISDVKVGTKSIKLKATSNRGLPVSFFVDTGPAIIKGSTLEFTGIPPRTKFPLEVRVTAWQWGTSTGEGVRRATNITQTFRILSSDQWKKRPRPQEKNVDTTHVSFDEALLWLSAGEKVTVFEDKVLHWTDKSKARAKLIPEGEVQWLPKSFNGKPAFRLSGKKTAIASQLTNTLSGSISILIVAASPKKQAFIAQEGVNNRILALSPDGKADYQGGITVVVGKNPHEAPRLIIVQKDLSDAMATIVLGAMATGGGSAGNFNATVDIAEVLIVPQTNEAKARAYLEEKYEL